MNPGPTPGASVEDVAESTEAKAGDAPGATGQGPPPSLATRLTTRLFFASVVVALVPVAVATTLYAPDAPVVVETPGGVDGQGADIAYLRDRVGG